LRHEANRRLQRPPMDPAGGRRQLLHPRPRCGSDLRKNSDRRGPPPRLRVRRLAGRHVRVATRPDCADPDGSPAVGESTPPFFRCRRGPAGRPLKPPGRKLSSAVPIIDSLSALSARACRLQPLTNHRRSVSYCRVPATFFCCGPTASCPSRAPDDFVPGRQANHRALALRGSEFSAHSRSRPTFTLAWSFSRRRSHESSRRPARLGVRLASIHSAPGGVVPALCLLTRASSKAASVWLSRPA